MKTAKDKERRIILNVCVNLVQAITMQTITAITNRSEVNRADSEGNQLSEGDFQGNIQENQKRQSVNMLTESDEDGLECEYSLFLGMINLDVNIIEKWTTTLQVGDTEVQFLMDTGAKCNVLTRDIYHKLNITAPLEKPEASLTSYS